MSKFLAPLDSETGGLDPKKVDMLTFYMAIVDDATMKIIDEVDLKLKPDGGRLPIVEQQALDVNKIDLRAHLADPNTITYSEARERIITMAKKYHRKYGRYNNIRPMGQNLQFDLDFIWVHLITKEEWDKIFHYTKIDTKTIVDFLKDAGWFPRDLAGLESVIKYLNLPLGEAHTAKADTIMCLDLYKHILGIMAAKKDGGSTQDLISLLEAE